MSKRFPPKHQTTNWRAYNPSLKQRGQLCHAAIVERGAATIIPPRRNGQFWKGKSLGNQTRNELLRSVKYLGQTLWKKWSGYHRRSLVETEMHCFKLLADHVKSSDIDRQVAELQVCAAILNRFTVLARRKRYAWDKSVWGLGELVPQLY